MASPVSFKDKLEKLKVRVEALAQEPISFETEKKKRQLWCSIETIKQYLNSEHCRVVDKEVCNLFNQQPQPSKA